jgi:hypothetical protein
MRWQIWQKSGPQEVPANLRQALVYQFRVEPQDAAKSLLLNGHIETDGGVFPTPAAAAGI